MVQLLSEVDPGAVPEDELAGIHRVFATSHSLAVPGEPYRSESETVGYLRYPPAGFHRLCWAGRVTHDRTVAVVCLDYGVGDTTGRVTLDVLPEWRRQGWGTTLLSAAATAARAAGLGALVGPSADAGGAAFAAASGAAGGRKDIRQLLGLRAAKFGHLVDAAFAARTDGYRIECWSGPAPSVLLESYALARNSIQDAPHADGAELHWTPEVVRDFERVLERRSRQMRIHTVVDRLGGVVAFTEIRTGTSPCQVASTEDTAVRRSERQRGLATWLKVASLSDLARERPDVEMVRTTNAAENGPMLAVNRKLGFYPVATIVEHRLELTAP